MRPSLSAVGEQVAGHVRGSLALEAAQPQWMAGLRTARKPKLLAKAVRTMAKLENVDRFWV